jgi:negative regulator of flagellin synthesis FlgM
VKIDNSVKSLGGVAPADARTRPAARSAPTASGDKVELSTLSSSLQQAEASMAATPVVDRARVDEIRQAISEGRFSIDASRVADGLIDSVRELLAGQTPRS